MLAPIARERMRHHEGNNVEVVTIVGSPSDQGLHRLSTRTPLGRALLGRHEGEEIQVVTEAATATFTIVRITT
jgi:transcription elongation GreA/GreB family factor